MTGRRKAQIGEVLAPTSHNMRAVLRSWRSDVRCDIEELPKTHPLQPWLRLADEKIGLMVDLADELTEAGGR